MGKLFGNSDSTIGITQRFFDGKLVVISRSGYSFCFFLVSLEYREGPEEKY